MNFLAHLHLAHLANSSLLGNLLADFIRGKPDDSLSPEIIAGVYMHRRIDAITDGLAEVAMAREWFRPETRRVSPISLDIIWDHFLSLHWKKITPDQPLTEFIDYARTQIEPQLHQMPTSFITLNQHLWNERWMERYSDMHFIANVLGAMAKRRPKLVQLRESCQDLETHYPALEALFWSFYPRLMHQAKQQKL